MTENIKKFLELVSQDEGLSRSFEEISKLEGDEAIEAVTKLAGERGITLTQEDFISKEPPTGELDEEELEVVAGGANCHCFMGGGGKVTNKDEKVCACVAVGFGDSLNGNAPRCGCSVVGFGDALPIWK